MYVKNICILEIYMHARSICMYFQKHKTTKSGLHFLDFPCLCSLEISRENILNQIIILAHQK